MKLHQNPPLVAQLFHADGRADMTKLTVAFRCFTNIPKNQGYTSIGESDTK